MESNYSENTSEGFLHFSQPATAERFAEVARKDLGETEELRDQCLRELRKLIEENKVASITTDEFLLRFLRTRKFNVQRSFESLRNYANQRVALHKRLLNLKPEVVEECMRLKTYSILPYRDADERLILLVDNDVWSPSICSDEDAATLLAVLCNYAADDPSAQVNGMIVIGRNAVPLPYIPYALRQIRFTLNFLFRNCLPIRYKRIHLVDAPSYFRLILGLVSPLIPKKIRERILLDDQSRDLLFQHISPSILPSDFGGSLGPLNNDHITDVILSYVQKLKDEQRYFLQANRD